MMAISDFIFRKKKQKKNHKKKILSKCSSDDFWLNNRDPQDPNILSLFYARRPRRFRNNSQLVRPVPVSFSMLKFGQKQRVMYALLCVTWCFSKICILVSSIYKNLLRSLDVSSLKNILLNSVFFEKLRRFDSSPFEANQTLVKCHIFKYCVSATLKPIRKKKETASYALNFCCSFYFAPFLPFRYLHNLLLANSFSTNFLSLCIRGKVYLLCLLYGSALIYSILRNVSL